MNRLFTQKRDKILTYRAIRAGKVKPARKTTCQQCKTENPTRLWVQNDMVCSQCGWHHPIGAYTRLWMLLDAGSFRELDASLAPSDPLSFPGYAKKLKAMQEQTGLTDGAVAALGTIRGHRSVFVVLDSRFMMGSMGTAVGEKVTRAVEYAAGHKLPLIIFSASGGARMQEGIFSLMQMAKTAAAITAFQQQGGLYISCLTHPTTGGVTASFASLGDIILAEPGALIGFAGPRVIEQTIGETLPKGFQRSEFLLSHGFLDQIVPRAQWPQLLSQLLFLHKGVPNA
ncbi:MAG: acetyl-CoA carboxylase, carboxyltransferase subunit beta [Oscillospiraceae bacterium]